MTESGAGGPRVSKRLDSAVTGVDVGRDDVNSDTIQAPALGPARILSDRFRLEQIIGQGGMGAVYRATQLGVTERTVAVKLILPAMGARHLASQRFKREAKAAARLNHPHTLRILEFGETDQNELFLVTEFLNGRTLDAELEERGALPPERALTIALRVAGALGEAHALGIVHRDIKPQNLFLQTVPGDSDFVRVIDFGLAVMPLEAGPTITQSHVMMGTPRYMPPEQAMARTITPATDVYALGVVLYEMLSGRAPFVAESSIQEAHAHIMEPVPQLRLPSGERPAPAVTELVLHCLQKDPALRPANGEVLRARIAALLSEPAPSSPSLAPPAPSLAPPAASISGMERAFLQRWRPGWALLAIVVVLGSAVAIPRLMDSANSPPVEPASSVPVPPAPRPVPVATPEAQTAPAKPAVVRVPDPLPATAPPASVTVAQVTESETVHPRRGLDRPRVRVRTTAVVKETAPKEQPIDIHTLDPEERILRGLGSPK